MITLALDASTYAGDVAVLDGTRVLAEEGVAMKGAEHERLMPAAADCLRRAGVAIGDVQRVVCGAGPGSFTSLRIASAIAKGIATGVGCPLYAVPSLALVIGGADLPLGRYLAALDALRGELYVGLLDLTLDSVVEVERARLILAASVTGVAEEYGAMIVSPAPIDGGIMAGPRARAVTKLEALLAERGPVDLGTWEPSYGRLAEAQVRWESAHGRPLPA